MYTSCLTLKSLPAVTSIRFNLMLLLMVMLMPSWHTTINPHSAC
jgi:hypothetical protein